MSHRIKATFRQELRVVGCLSAVGIAFSLVAYLVVGGSTTEGPPGGTLPGAAYTPEEPAPQKWRPTEEFRAEAGGTGLTVLSFHVDPSAVTILFALDSTSGERVVPNILTVTGEEGRSYRVASNAILGSQLGVTVGSVTAEGFGGEAGSVRLSVSELDATDSEGSVRHDKAPLSVAFVENVSPGLVDYTLNMKIAPEVTTVGDLTFSKAGGPALREIKVLVDRGGVQAAIYSLGTRGVTQAEFESIRGGDLPAPPGFPSPGQ